MISTTIAFFITIGACISTYFWGKRQMTPEVVINSILDKLKADGYLKTKIDENGEEELIKLDD
jgi:hypothetical protein|tara:strand:- start:405 stop:593 length:189 start_codon:yes stop_codon:yes gene_type:complete